MVLINQIIHKICEECRKFDFGDIFIQPCSEIPKSFPLAPKKKKILIEYTFSFYSGFLKRLSNNIYVLQKGFPYIFHIIGKQKNKNT
jgi:hypothetical protein